MDCHARCERVMFGAAAHRSHPAPTDCAMPSATISGPRTNPKQLERLCPTLSYPTRSFQRTRTCAHSRDLYFMYASGCAPAMG